ncbi:MAG: hypothetical protein ABIN80_17700 [Dyadobacter sp.]|uniref:hypothetical protein n=1 Tax=Dyadobacter sp. TaxID=1914288 RepID=UPI003264BD4E
MKLGTNGNVSLGGIFGITPKYNASLNLWQNTAYNDQVLNDVAYNKIWHGIWPDTTHSAQIGADYLINSKNTVGFSTNARVSNRRSVSEDELD